MVIETYKKFSCKFMQPNKRNPKTISLSYTSLPYSRSVVPNQNFDRDSDQLRLAQNTVAVSTSLLPLRGGLQGDHWVTNFRIQEVFMIWIARWLSYSCGYY